MASGAAGDRLPGPGLAAGHGASRGRGRVRAREPGLGARRDGRPGAGGVGGRRSGGPRAAPFASAVGRAAAAPRAGRRARAGPGDPRPRRADGEPGPGRRRGILRAARGAGRGAKDDDRPGRAPGRRGLAARRPRPGARSRRRSRSTSVRRPRSSPDRRAHGRRRDLAARDRRRPGRAPAGRRRLPVTPAPQAASRRTRRPSSSPTGLRFGYERDVPVIRDLSLSIGLGERVALVGPNGGGKSTLGRLLVGLLAAGPWDASISAVTTRHASTPNDLSRLAGYVFQDPEAGFLADIGRSRGPPGADGRGGRAAPDSDGTPSTCRWRPSGPAAHTG